MSSERQQATRRGLTKHVTPHMLRHTTVVWSLAAGVRIEVVSEQLGHASLQITYDVYGGLINLHDPVMAEAMSREMITVAEAIVPAPSTKEVESRTIRPVAKPRVDEAARGGCGPIHDVTLATQPTPLPRR